MTGPAGAALPMTSTFLEQSMYVFPPEVWIQLTDEFDLRTDYGGRAMFGITCIGVIGQVGDLLRFAAACRRTADELGLPGEELIDALARAVRSDNMGHEQIFYFPGVALDPDSNR
jgi:hypothetical protein